MVDLWNGSAIQNNRKFPREMDEQAERRWESQYQPLFTYLCSLLCGSPIPTSITIHLVVRQRIHDGHTDWLTGARLARAHVHTCHASTSCGDTCGRNCTTAPLHFVIPLWHFTRLQAADPPISYKTYSNLTSLWTAYHLQSVVCLQANSELFPSFSFITCQRYFGLHPWYFKIMTLSSTEKLFYCRQMKFSWLCSYNYSLN